VASPLRVLLGLLCHCLERLIGKHVVNTELMAKKHRKDIRFLGLADSYDQDRARQSALHIIEVGYFAKVLVLGRRSVIAYSHKPFTVKESIISLGKSPF